MALTGVGSHLPLWKGARFATLAFAAVAVALLALNADRYPLGTIPGPCAPCVCDDAGVLKACPYHAELKDPVLWIGDRKVTAVSVNAFERNEGAASFRLENNEIKTLPVGVFDILQNPVVNLELTTDPKPDPTAMPKSLNLSLTRTTTPGHQSEE